MARRNTKTSSPYRQASLFDDCDFIDVEASGAAGERQKDVTESELAVPMAEMSDLDKFSFMSFGSGSSGNCYYIGNSRGGVLVDAGVDIKQVETELKRNNINPESILGICLTHDHGDHIKYAYSFLRRYKKMALFCTNRVLNGILRRHNISRRIKDYHHAIFKEIPFKVGDFEFTAFEVPHDGSCNSGYSISYGDARFVFATDLGSVTERARHYMTQANYLVVESNYDFKMLVDGEYPEYLKSRILSPEKGHMDNESTAAFLRDAATKRLKYVWLCHLSADNNKPEIARATSKKALEAAGLTVGDGEMSIIDTDTDVQLVVLPRFDATRLYMFHVSGESLLNA